MDFGFSVVPEELYDIFNRKDIGYSLLIKGTAGTGKSTFALTLVSLFKNRKALYISTRVAPPSLYSHFPWVEKVIEEENILDATQTYLPPVDSPENLRMHVIRIVRFENLPDFLRVLYEKIGDDENTIVIIDSWEAVTAGSKKPEPAGWENVLTEFVRQMKIKLILISERTEQTFLDYIVDGIITLKDAEYADRVIREIVINKIRGVARWQKRYNFTLYNNRFIYCRGYYGDDSEIVENDKDPNAKFNKAFTDKILKNGASQFDYKSNLGLPQYTEHNYYGTGIPDLDKIYGGLKSPSLNLLEIESDVPIHTISNLLLPLVCNFITENCGTIIYTMEGLNSRFIDKYKLLTCLDTRSIEDKVRYLVETRQDSNYDTSVKIIPYSVPFTGGTVPLMETFASTYSELAEKTGFRPVLSIFSYDFLTLHKDLSEYSGELYDHLKFVRNYNIIEFGLINSMEDTGPHEIRQRSEKNLIKRISYFFDTHIKIFFKNNAVFLYGIKPYTGIYWLRMENTGKILPKINLIPMI